MFYCNFPIQLLLKLRNGRLVVIYMVARKVRGGKDKKVGERKIMNGKIILNFVIVISVFNLITQKIMGKHASGV